MSLCLASAGVVKALSLAAFTLAWTHSVEKTEWQEDWRVTSQGLEIVEARIKGSGAGMEPPSDARLVEGWFRWAPQVPTLPEVILGNSDLAGEWRICSGSKCQTFSDIFGQPVGTNATTMRFCSAAIQPVPEKPDVKALLVRANEFSTKGDYDRALTAYDAALKIDPAHAGILNHRGLAWRAKGDRRRALADFEAALRSNPGFEAARSNRKSLFQEIERIGATMPLRNDKLGGGPR
jgi:hypothetical protein